MCRGVKAGSVLTCLSSSLFSFYTHLRSLFMCTTECNIMYAFRRGSVWMCSIILFVWLITLRPKRTIDREFLVRDQGRSGMQPGGGCDCWLFNPPSSLAIQNRCNNHFTRKECSSYGVVEVRKRANKQWVVSDRQQKQLVKVKILVLSASLRKGQCTLCIAWMYVLDVNCG